MRLYRLGIVPPESEGEGEDHDEWFQSLREAKKRRKELIDMSPALLDHRTGTDYEIEVVDFVALPLRKLLLAVLNRTGYAERRREVVPPYEPSPAVREKALRQRSEEGAA